MPLLSVHTSDGAYRLLVDIRRPDWTEVSEGDDPQSILLHHVPSGLLVTGRSKEEHLAATWTCDASLAEAVASLGVVHRVEAIG